MENKSIKDQKKQDYIDKQMRMLNKKVKKNDKWFKGFVLDKPKSQTEHDLDMVENHRKRNCYEAKLKMRKMKGN